MSENNIILANNKIEVAEMNDQEIMDQNYKYFLEYQKLNDANSILSNQLSTLIKERNSLKHNLNKLEDKNNILKSQIVVNDTYNSRRRKRRTKNEIKRNFECSFAECKKRYGSEGSLNQHYKLKHKNI